MDLIWRCDMWGRWLAVLALVAGTAGLAGCGVGPTTPSSWSDPTEITYYAGLHVNLARMSKTASGVFYWDSIPGTGTVAAREGDQVTVHYTLWLPDGTLVDNYNGQAFTTTLDTTYVIKGWVDGLSGVVQGTTRQLVIPPALAYGEYGSGAVPGNTTLVFLVAVDRVTPAASDTAASGDVAASDRIAAALVNSGAAARFR